MFIEKMIEEMKTYNRHQRRVMARNSMNENEALKQRLDKATGANIRPMNPEIEIAATAAMIRVAPQLAKMRKVMFDAYVAEGFTVEQALVLCVK